MQNDLFEYSISQIVERFSQFPDKRVGANKFIKMQDIGLSAFAIFFTQSPSFLEAQKVMRAKNGHDNANSLFKISYIPTDNHIRNLLDDVPASEVFPLLPTILNSPQLIKPVDDFRYLSDQLLIALDGVQYFSLYLGNSSIRLYSIWLSCMIEIRAKLFYHVAVLKVIWSISLIDVKGH